MSELSKIDVICDMSKFTSIKKELSELNVGGMTFTQVLGCGVEGGTRSNDSQTEKNPEMALLPKIQVSIVVETKRVKKITDELLDKLYTGHIGDGKIFIYSLDNAIRVRTGEEGVEAL
ncbi:MAG: P-II family nitrogen regulator [Lachnospiraceae bacterium]|uniref:P-II family nitrogen regulator n=1 Tax=Candidatus Weimeria bifida TaxID=2599074 RepID=A0A6N7IZD0_9FIRM|nr:P-II family nitrogen regulator [Candidatus Weimeria bifida]RRF95110.1 MAG: P-II family nitrogen regulator [Lachnospiraceae bacterium]